MKVESLGWLSAEDWVENNDAVMVHKYVVTTWLLFIYNNNNNNIFYLNTVCFKANIAYGAV